MTAMTIPLDAARRLRREVLGAIGRGVRTGRQIHRASVRIGSSYGGWDVLPDLVSPSAVVYSFGIGDDVSWDLAMIDRFGVRVNGFDPTPRSVRWVRSRELPSPFVFYPLGLADFDGDAQFVMRDRRPHWSSYNLARSRGELSGAFETASAPVARLATIMKRLGHDSLDVMKLDIEGTEYEALEDMLASHIYPKQLLVEFHYSYLTGHRIGRTARLISRLNGLGYRAFARSPRGYEFSFVRE